MTRSGPVMAQLAQARSGDRAELDELMPVVCRELRACAGSRDDTCSGSRLDTLCKRPTW